MKYLKSKPKLTLASFILLITFSPYSFAKDKAPVSKPVSTITPMKTIGKTTNTSNSTCSEISKLIKKSKSMKDLKKSLQKIGKSKVSSCKSKLANDNNVKNSFSRLVKSMKVSKSIKPVKKTTTLKMNKKVIELKRLGANETAKVMRFPPRSATQIAAKPSKGSSSRPRVIKTIPDTVVPGVELAINGEGFGEQQGSLQIKIGNMSFDAQITSWTNNWITVKFSDSISHVPPTNSAELIIRKGAGGTVTGNIKFIPLYEEKYLTRNWSRKSQVGDIFAVNGQSGTITLFENTWNRTLKNQWRVSRYSISVGSTKTRCRIQSPKVERGSANLKTRIDWSSGWLESSFCMLDVMAEGPVGLSPEVEAFL